MTDKERKIKYLAERIRERANYESKATKAELCSRLTTIYVHVCCIERLLTRETK